MIDMNTAMTVSQLNKYVKMLMDADEVLNYVTLRGEISSFKLHSSGHMYFTLKDEASEISAVMFRGAASRLAFAPKNGMKVVAYGKVSVYETTGKYQLYVNAMTADGAGALYAEYMRLREALRAEGLFDDARKRRLPCFPRRIGIVTSPTGAAIRDMISITGRRYPSAEILLCPSAVQGAEAPAELIRGLNILNAVGGCDVIIIGRGGGSDEDLWAFNDEALVRAVAASPTPVISAVGHETDTTLCDFAADKRAPTPSAAAELAVPDGVALMHTVDACAEAMDGAVSKLVDGYRARLDVASAKIRSASPTARLERAELGIRRSRERMDETLDALTERLRLRLGGAVRGLEAVNPLAVLGRGYSVTRDENGGVISSVDSVKEGDSVSVRVSDGFIDAEVVCTRTLKEEKNGTKR